MEFRILGSLSVSADSVPIRLGGHKEQGLLAALVINADRVVSTDRLIDIMWGEEPPSTATKTLRSYISRLRSRLKSGGEPIETVSGGYLFHRTDHEVDSIRFEELLSDARTQRERGSHSGAVVGLSEALELWRGPALLDLDDFDFARMEAARLGELRLEAIEARIDSELHLGHHNRLVAELEGLVELHPLREGLWGALMTALYRSGRQAESLRAFQRARLTLGEELGIEPSQDLQDLEQAILIQSEPTTPAAGGDRFDLLPVARTSFIGREDEISDLRELLGNERCVTVTGTGGAGKTRLIAEAARGVTDDFRHGVLFVGLGSVLEPTSVPEYVAAALGDVGSHADNVTAALVEFLRTRNLLLVLDNCEHLVREVAELVDRLLAGCPGLTVLSTSREPISTQGEIVFKIRPLEVPLVDEPPLDQDRTESVRLFVARAKAYDRRFVVDSSNRGAVVSICRSLDGIPLAIELAAARVGAMAPSEIAARMDDRLALLDTGARTSPARHQTLRATIDWSYGLCSDEARTVLRRLSVFAGGWTLEAAEAVVADDVIERPKVAGILGGLVDRNLVERTAASDGSRYRLLETIRQYAFDALVTAGEAPAVAGRHCDWFVDVAERAEPALRDERQVEHLRLLDVEHDNARAAIGWSLGTRDPSGAFRLVGALGWYWFMRGHWHEAWRWVNRCLDYSVEVDPSLWSKVVYATGSIEIIRGKLDPISELMERAVAECRRAGDRLGEAWALHYLGHAGGWTGAESAKDKMEQALGIFEDLGESWAVGWSWRYLGQSAGGEEAITLQRRALDRFLELGDRWCAAYSLYLIGSTLLVAERYDEAETAEQEALDIATELGDVIWSAHATGRLGAAAFFQGHIDKAIRLIDEGLELHRRIGDDNCVGVLLGYRGLIAISQESWSEALAAVAGSLRLWQKLGNQAAAVAHVVRFSRALAGSGDPRAAAVLFGATTAPDVPRFYFDVSPFRQERADLEQLLQTELGAEFDALVAEGADLELAEAIDRGLATVTL